MSFEFRVPAIGVEEEYQLVSPESGELAPKCRTVLRRASRQTTSDLQHELHLEQIEMASPVLNSSAEVRRCLAETRGALIAAAREQKSALVSAGTHPMHIPAHVHITPVSRYQDMADRFQMLARELMIFGCHVHVNIADSEVGVQVMNRLRCWLPLLQAMTANSPFWNGQDTGYASYRRELWAQWPLAGIPHHFESFDAYNACVQDLVAVGAIDDETKVYWDMRLPVKTPTLEFRVFDAITDVEDVVAVATICRALVMRCEQEVARKTEMPRYRSELLKAAMWQAARFGLSNKVIDAPNRQAVPASEALDRLRDFIAEPLAYLEDEEVVDDFLRRLKSDGVGADLQRRYFHEAEGSLAALVSRLAEMTTERVAAPEPS